MVSIRFLGAAGTVTGSRFLVRTRAAQVLVDAGLFQGLKELRLRNWAPFPVRPAELDAVVLTHAHIDHSGALPLLARNGFRKEVVCTPATLDLARLMLPDAAKLQEEEARYANRRGYSKHAPNARPLFDEMDALTAIGLLSPVAYHVRREIAPGIAVTFEPAGHILGSATALLEVREPHGRRTCRILFSGDLGRYGMPILPDPAPARAADYLVLESTYADRDHPPSPRSALRDVVNAAVARGGALVIPAFAVGRTQEILFELRALEDAGEIPELPMFVDSPMAVDATAIHAAHREDHDADMAALLAKGVEPLRPARLKFARAAEQSKAINAVEGPCIILSASGMATGGRVLHHLKNRLPDPRTTVLLVGYQAAGTRGWSLQRGASTLRIHGEDVPVRARVESVAGFSAHADRDELARWMATAPRKFRTVFCVHGESTALTAAQQTLERGGLHAVVPRHLEEHPLH
jgi:metallo-beta-lactamase family protein